MKTFGYLLSHGGIPMQTTDHFEVGFTVFAYPLNEKTEHVIARQRTGCGIYEEIRSAAFGRNQKDVRIRGRSC